LSFSTFGRAKPVAADIGSTVRPRTPAPATGGGSSSGFLRGLDKLFLGIPNERAPGVLAVLVFFARQFGFTAIAALLFVAGWFIFAPPVFGGALPTLPAWARFFVVAPLIFFEELGRYSFVRRAERPLRALAFFTIPVVAICALDAHNDLYELTWMTSSTVLASAVIYWGLGRRRHLAYVVAGLFVAHTAVYMAAPSYDPARATWQAPSNLAPVAPKADMENWAKLYPGAVISRSSVSTMLSLTDWKVEYSVQASPQEIDAFYRGIARAGGFDDETDFGGERLLEQDSTGDRFSYSVWRRPDGSSEVSFDARRFSH
jgi:hypothetical protein